MNRFSPAGFLPVVSFLSFLVLLPLTLFGQGSGAEADSLRADFLPEIPYGMLSLGACGMFLVPPDEPFLLIRDSAAFAELVESRRSTGQCRDTQVPQVDYTRNAVVGFEFFADCNAELEIALLYDTAAREYRIIVHEAYGGCRALRGVSFWLLIPALKEGERVRVEERRDKEW